MKLIIGLGNPGKKYEYTWHNAGFLTVDKIHQSDEYRFSKFTEEKKFNAVIAQGAYDEEKIVLAKPQTFMNNSGQAVQALTHFYKVRLEDLWIIHDDVDLLLGKIRISKSASAAGHRGVQSIIAALGTQNFTRFRIGIRPNAQLAVETDAYVLQKISKNATVVFEQALGNIQTAVALALTENPEKAMNFFN